MAPKKRKKKRISSSLPTSLPFHSLIYVDTSGMYMYTYYNYCGPSPHPAAPFWTTPHILYSPSYHKLPSRGCCFFYLSFLPLRLPVPLPALTIHPSSHTSRYLKLIILDHESANFFYKEKDNEYFRI